MYDVNKYLRLHNVLYTDTTVKNLHKDYRQMYI